MYMPPTPIRFPSASDYRENLMYFADWRRAADHQQGRQQLVAGQEGRRRRVRRPRPLARAAGVEDGHAGKKTIFSDAVSDAKVHDMKHTGWPIQLVKTSC